MIIIERYGRFGNNIIQLIHAIHVAKKLNISKIKFPFPDFIFKEITISKMVYGEKNITDTFFYSDTIIKKYAVEPLSYEVSKKYIQIYISPLLKYKPGFLSSFSIDFATTLFIHIRSGDIFQKNAHKDYVPVPYDFYTLILDSKPWTQVFVIYEDDKNPVINRLKKDYPSFKYLTLEFSETISIFLEAKFIVSGYGSFILGILFFNNNVKNLYLPSYSKSAYTHLFPPNKTIFIKSPDYIDKWSVNESNLDKIISYRGSVFE